MERLARRKVSTTIYLTMEQDESLRQLSDDTGVPVAEYVRRGINIIREALPSEGPVQMSVSGRVPDLDDFALCCCGHIRAIITFETGCKPWRQVRLPAVHRAP